MSKKESVQTIVKDFVVPGLKAFLTGHVEDSVDRIKKAAHQAERDLEHKLATGSLFVFGMIFFVLGISLLIAQYTQLGYGWSFLMMGFSLIFISMVFMIMRK